mmetsp:Transcript_95991/g.248221  ORF Transcript_95991/g.248221 Transcript_95991/m.248221 type:complete len:213 (+) Transcript_95991:176-814(+)
MAQRSLQISANGHTASRNLSASAGWRPRGSVLYLSLHSTLQLRSDCVWSPPPHASAHTPLGCNGGGCNASMASCPSRCKLREPAGLDTILASLTSRVFGEVECQRQTHLVATGAGGYQLLGHMPAEAVARNVRERRIQEDLCNAALPCGISPEDGLLHDMACSAVRRKVGQTRQQLLEHTAACAPSMLQHALHDEVAILVAAQPVSILHNLL